MTCSEIQALLDAFLDGELRGEEMRSVARHLAVCPTCEAESLRMERLQGAVRSAVLAAVPAVDARVFWNRLAPRLEPPGRGILRRLRTLVPDRRFAAARSPLLWAGAAAAVLALGLMLSRWDRRDGGPTVRGPQIAQFSGIESLRSGNVRVWNRPESDTLVIWVDDQGLAMERLD
jgi:anti-sigma factor RsiW